MRASWILPAAAAVLLTGCGDLLSVQGIANPGNTVFDPALLGAWNSGDAVVIVQAGDDRSYRIHWLDADSGTESPELVRMEAHLATVGGQRLLDLTSSGPGAFALACHVFLRVRPVADGLKLQFVDSNWIRQQITAPLSGFALDDHPVLTAPGPQIEAFLLKFGLDERALDDPILLRPLKQN